ncbi:MAG: type IV secretory system conjugative DNA transfer family protein, partial [Nakamurella sp.]
SVGEQRARERARYTRRASIARGLDVDSCPLNEVGTHIADKTDDGEPIVLTHEDQIVVFCPTGGGKTLTVGIPVGIDAPGPLVATSTKPEVLDALVEQRASRGRIWVFDPLDLAGWPEPMIWNPINGSADSEIATARAKAFTAGMTADDSSDSSNPFFQTAAGIIIARLLHAAALGECTIVDVISWALDIKASTAAQDILADAENAEIMWSKTLKVATDGADETISSVRMTLAQKVEPILSRKVLRQMLPREGVVEFDATAFVQSQDTLVLITDDNAATNVAPLTTMLLDDVFGASKRVAARSMTARLDPILRIVGDEIANVAPIPKLPKILSDSRGHGVQWFVMFQSMAQIIARWGTDGAEQLAASVNGTIVMGGLQDTRGLERFSELVGSADVEQVSTTLGDRNVATSHNVSTTERRLMRGDQIRQLPENKALMIYRNAPAMVVDLIPWFDRPDAAAIEAGIEHIRRIRISHA